jgi:hypothetical protein
VNSFLRYTFVGLVSGLIFGCLISLVSGDLRIIPTIGGLGLVIGVILGIIHRNK